MPMLFLHMFVCMLVCMLSTAVHHCGQAGLAVGYSSSSSDMIAPWLQYHTYGVKVTNNVIHDVWGAGLSVYGGYNVLMAHNTLYK